MDFILAHWLSAGAGIFLLIMILRGHYRGFLKIAVSMSALILSLVIVRVATPYMTDFLRQNTTFHRIVEQGVSNLTEITQDTLLDTALPSGQRLLIEQLPVPDMMKDVLIENNNNEVYRILGVEKFFDYISAYIVNMVLTVIASILLFIAMYIILRLLMSWLDLIARIPIIAGINQIAGALLGAVQGLLLLWGAGLVVSFCSQTAWAAVVLAQISQSIWLSFLYQNNIFNWLLIGIIKNLI